MPPEGAATFVTAPAQEAERRVPPWRSPWVWAAVAGMLVVTLMRPLMRRDATPTVLGEEIPPFALERVGGGTFDRESFAGRATVVALVDASCLECERIWQSLELVARRLAEEPAPASVAIVSVVGDAPPALAARAAAVMSAGAGVELVTGSPEAACPLAQAAFAELAGGLPCDRLGEAARASRLVLVDGRGRVRGTYATDRMGTSEAYHRCLALAREEMGRRARPRGRPM